MVMLYPSSVAVKKFRAPSLSILYPWRWARMRATDRVGLRERKLYLPTMDPFGLLIWKL